VIETPFPIAPPSAAGAPAPAAPPRPPGGVATSSTRDAARALIGRMPTSDVRPLADALERSLREVGSPDRAAHEKRYLRSSLVHVGASVPAIRRAAVALSRAHPELSRAALLALVDELWGRGIHECRMAAVELLDVHLDRLEARDLVAIERLLRESGTWALVDPLAATVAGPLVERFPALGRRLDAWAKDPDFWIRRAALLAHLVPLREGRGDFARFARYADTMLEEQEFFIRKAIGWVLRDAGRRAPETVARYLKPRASRAAGLTVREAVKYLPAADRAAILAAAGKRAAAPPRAHSTRTGARRR
jgi:3-methyladenine DNA glycosylase AlkD